MQETAFPSKGNRKKDTKKGYNAVAQKETKTGYNREGVQRGERKTSEFIDGLRNKEYGVRFWFLIYDKALSTFSPGLDKLPLTVVSIPFNPKKESFSTSYPLSVS